MDYCSLLIAAILFFQHFYGACANDTAETENRYTKKAGSPRCKNKPHYCRATDGPRRVKGGVNFTKSWAEYRDGFGSFDGDFWIGNQFIHQLTTAGYTDMRVDMKYQGRHYYARYKNFVLSNETLFYRINFNSYTGNASNSLDQNPNRGFATFDSGPAVSSHCARAFGGCWWYRDCGSAMLNGVWGSRGYGLGIYWTTVTGVYNSLSFVEMKVRKPNP
ncbi:ficolin-1-like isoform X2 [Physella acuta]|uniref:ficolin-1-like isoform X2 n=1 Tax=Physella acuta TaxID=109671 RepID=UPI0027DE2AD9|nr:ficolin-1-like isoform X2 [Physella acuta]XP_059165772.1 ficolin-1-like isoform X2 [Physella acuta]